MRSGGRLSLAICGLGRFATRRIVPAIAECANIELTAVVDRSGGVQDLPVSVRRFVSIDDFLKTTPIGAVYIASPNYLHAQQSLQCLAAGLHVLCEKPMATNSSDCQTMLKTARNLNLHLRVGHMLRHSPALQLARQWMQDGVVGKPHTISANFYYDLPEVNRPWAFRRESSGGGALMDAGIHCIDAIRLLVGDPVNSLTADTDRNSHKDGIERSAECCFTANGVSCTIKVRSQSPYETRLTVSGTEGDIVIDNFAACWGAITVKLYARESCNPVKEATVDVSAIYRVQLRDFAKAIDQSEGVSFQDCSAAENVRIVEELYAIS